MIRLTTLGAVDLRDAKGRRVGELLAQPKRIALLAYLVLESRKGPVPRDRLLALFWPESDDTHARNTLSQALHHIRQALGAEAIENHGAAAVGASRIWSDATAFLEALERGKAALSLDLYRGDFCPALFAPGCPDVEQWLDEQRGSLRRRALAASRALAERTLERGDGAAAILLAQRALALRPDDENDVRALIGLLDRAGDGTAALLAYREWSERLARELETEPAPETVRLADEIRRRREGVQGVQGVQSVQAVSAVPPSHAPHAPHASRTRLRAGMAAVVAFLALGAVALRARSANPAPLSNTVAVLPFSVHGTSHAYLGEGMVDLLTAKLGGVAGYRALDPRWVIGRVRGDGEEDRPDLGADWYVDGSVIENAGRVQLTASLYRHDSSEPAATANVTGDTASLFELIDNLSGRLLTGLLPGRDTTLSGLAAVTTQSLPALKAYLAGEQAMREGRDAEAAVAFQEAVALDTTFALAQYRVALIATWTPVPGVVPVEWADRAARNARRLTPLARDLLAAFQSYRRFMKDAETRYQAIVQAHPENVEAWLMLAETHFHNNPWWGRSSDVSRADFYRVLTLDPDNVHAELHLARLAALHGRRDEIDSLASRFLGRNPDASRALEMRALRALTLDDAAELARVESEVRLADEFVRAAVTDAALSYAQNLPVGRRLFEATAGLPVGPAISLYRGRLSGDLPLAAGSHAPAASLGDSVSDYWRLETRTLIAAEPFFRRPRSEIAALRDSITRLRGQAPPASIRDLMRTAQAGLLSVQLRDTAAVARAVHQLAAVQRADLAGVAANLRATVRSQSLRLGGDLDGAIREMRQFEWDSAAARTVRSMQHWGIHERFLLGELYLAARRDAEALPWFESMTSQFEMAWYAPTHLRLAQIKERLGRPREAAFHYRRFASLWADADSLYQPLVREALGRVRNGP